MKKNIVQQIIFIALALPLNSSFYKIDLPLALPEETQIGANTFGCKVDGEVWRVMTEKEREKGSVTAFGLIVDIGQDSIISISAIDHLPNAIPDLSFSLFFKIKPINNPITTRDTINGIIMRDYRSNIAALYRSCRDCYSCITCSISPDQKDSATITLTRFDDKIVSGKFEGKLISYNHPSVIITEGRFDIKLKP